MCYVYGEAFKLIMHWQALTGDLYIFIYNNRYVIYNICVCDVFIYIIILHI